MKDMNSLQNIDWDSLTFSLTPTRSMYMATCNAGEEWDPGKLVPFGDISFSPAAGVLNYGQGVFEGMKAFRTVKDRIVLFRPEKNAVRAAGSAQRVCIPPVPTEMFLDAVKSVVKDNADYIPPFGKGSLYIRPVIWGSGPILGVAPAPSYMFLVYVSPVGPYFKSGVKSLHLKITNQYHRAAPKGTGGHKIVGNYAVSLYPQQLAKKSGFDEAIYLNAADERFIEEVGSANIFILKDDVLTTPSLDGSILPGVTRASVLKIAREKLNLQIRQRNVSVHELLNADEVFCTGTAVVVTPVGMITTNLHSQTINNNEMGPITTQLREMLLGIQQETHEDPFGWICPLDE
ncbi:MAG: branched-chain amino acid aminotransferase [Candidatus Marinimicrobia bacterium]|nr:branched-chain amino acid aminotransferase [Candidatus Neomarinimicrobiota bacterium]MBL7060061.1 branched-chain amino acid aminotransferase [Candidatus Neomarinimicrobiota bacterium]